jgi:hypothetical protein
MLFKKPFKKQFILETALLKELLIVFVEAASKHWPAMRTAGLSGLWAMSETRLQVESFQQVPAKRAEEFLFLTLKKEVISGKHARLVCC